MVIDFPFLRLNRYFEVAKFVFLINLDAFLEDENMKPWEDFGKFSTSDVHRQVRSIQAMSTKVNLE